MIKKRTRRNREMFVVIGEQGYRIKIWGTFTLPKHPKRPPLIHNGKKARR